ncbi:MAG TPA: hypothetical protein VF756_13690, partial [Thermoanaerobaculia bacterium]
MNRRPRLALTQGDPAGIGPEILLKLLASAAALAPREPSWEPLVVAERAALEPLRPILPHVSDIPWDRFRYLSSLPSREELEALDGIPVLDPVGEPRALAFGESGPADAAGAMAALDAGIALVRSGAADAL